MATFQTMVRLPELSEATLQSRFLQPRIPATLVHSLNLQVQLLCIMVYFLRERSRDYRELEGIVGTVILELESLSMATERIMGYTDATRRAPTYS